MRFLFTSFSRGSLFLCACAIGLCIASCSRKSSHRIVVLYCSLDDIFARPIITEFENQSGIDVKEVFDSESVKTVGLTNRILLERKKPRADVFWNSEFSRTVALSRQNAFAAYRSPSAADIPARYKNSDGLWTGYACRARVICYNSARLARLGRPLPRSIFELTKPEWRERIAICDPVLGTAACWVSALTLQSGEKKAENYFRELRSNGAQIVPGNSVVADLVVNGRVDIGVTDTDDVFLRKKQKKPIECIFPDQDGIGTLTIPATVALIQGAPHLEEAKRLIDFLLSQSVEGRLAEQAGHMPVRSFGGRGGEALAARLKTLRTMTPSYDAIGLNVEKAARKAKQLLGL